MSTYTIKLGRRVTEFERATIEVEAASEQEARAIVERDMAKNDQIYLAVEWENDGYHFHDAYIEEV